ncbi:S-adenosyl-L-methionine-dependent methyltransferase, partial [Dichotomocladium elegans]
DVGYGCGDSCFWLSDQYGCNVTGITNEAEQWLISRARLAEDSAFTHLQDRVCLIQGSATDLARSLDDSEAYNGTTVFDHIICIDSAYHYSTRWDFLQAARSRLAPGGTIGLYDLAMADTGRDRALLKGMLQLLLGIPVPNLVVTKEYKARLEAMGYMDIQIEPLDRNLVFGGLSRAIRQQYERAAAMDVLPAGASRAFMKITSWLFNLVNQKEWLVPVIVRATAGGHSDSTE